MLIGRSDLGEVLKRRISISTTARSFRTSWGLMFTTMVEEFMILLDQDFGKWIQKQRNIIT